MNEKGYIYLDHAATTPMLPEVAAAMQPFLSYLYGNPSSIHGAGREARRAVEHAREQLAQLVGCKPSQLVFTSSGTDAVHHALMGTFLGAQKAADNLSFRQPRRVDKPSRIQTKEKSDRNASTATSDSTQGRRHIVTTAFEHHAVLHTCELLEELGAEVTYVAPDENCRIRTEAILDAMRPDTLMVTVLAVNNETGSVQPIEELARRVKTRDSDVLVHSDMVQALPVKSINLSATDLDFASFSAHKIHGPKGVGALYLKGNANWISVLRGGNQERQRRGGTENVPGIVGFGAAANALQERQAQDVEYLQGLGQRLWTAIGKIPGAYRNSPADAVPTILNVGFEGVANDALLMRLDLEGVLASAGSACTAGTLQPSHVLAACGLSKKILREAVRFSISNMTREKEISEAANRIAKTVESLRQHTF